MSQAVLEQIKTALAAKYPARKVTRSYLDISEQQDADLEAGVYTIMSRGARGFDNLPGREAVDGTLRVWILAQIKATEDSTGVDVENAEFAMFDEIKAFLQGLPVGIDSLLLTDYVQSGQIERPYGWILFSLEMMS